MDRTGYNCICINTHTKKKKIKNEATNLRENKGEDVEKFGGKKESRNCVIIF